MQANEVRMPASRDVAQKVDKAPHFSLRKAFTFPWQLRWPYCSSVFPFFLFSADILDRFGKPGHRDNNRPVR